MKEVLMATFTGMVVGALFSLIKLPIPAPPTFAGVMGIVGIFLGYLFVKWIIGA
jgi:XapX domain-containing protein